MKKILTIILIWLFILSLGLVFGLKEKGIKFLGTSTTTSDFSYPTSTHTFVDDDIVNAGDLNEIIRWLGIRTATDTDSISYKLISTSSGDPGHYHTKLTTSTPPITSTSTCTTGQINFDASYFYFCAATDTWRRATSTTF